MTFFTRVPSLEQHLRTVLTESAGAQKRSLLQIAKSCRERLEQELGGALADRNADLVREMREETIEKRK